jgi:lysophospholipase L1-like esterase
MAPDGSTSPRGAVAAQEPSTIPSVPETPSFAATLRADVPESQAAPNEPSPVADPPEPLPDPDWPADRTGKGCTSPIWPVAAGAPRVLVIGDSLTRDSRDLLEEGLEAAGWAPTVRCWGTMGTAWGRAQIERAEVLDQLPETVVVALGTNDIWWIGVPIHQGVAELMAALGPDREVLWVNFAFGQNRVASIPDTAKANADLADAASSFPNLRIIDFQSAMADASREGASWTDGVHLNEAANRARVAAIVAALEQG